MPSTRHTQACVFIKITAKLVLFLPPATYTPGSYKNVFPDDNSVSRQGTELFTNLLQGGNSSHTQSSHINYFLSIKAETVAFRV